MRLLVEQDESFLVIDDQGGTSAVLGGPAQPAPRRAGSDDDNVIELLMSALTPQLGADLLGVAYVGDFLLVDGAADVCRVYACPRDELQPTNGSGACGARWHRTDRLAAETGDRYLAAAAERWLAEPMLRGIGQSNV